MFNEFTTNIRYACINFYQNFGALNLLDMSKEEINSIANSLLLLSDSFKMINFGNIPITFNDKISEEINKNSSLIRNLANNLFNIDINSSSCSKTSVDNIRTSAICLYQSCSGLNFDKLYKEHCVSLSSSIFLISNAFNRIYQRVLVDKKFDNMLEQFNKITLLLKMIAEDIEHYAFYIPE